MLGPSKQVNWSRRSRTAPDCKWRARGTLRRPRVNIDHAEAPVKISLHYFRGRKRQPIARSLYSTQPGNRDPVEAGAVTVVAVRRPRLRYSNNRHDPFDCGFRKPAGGWLLRELTSALLQVTKGTRRRAHKRRSFVQSARRSPAVTLAPPVRYGSLRVQHHYAIPPGLVCRIPQRPTAGHKRLHTSLLYLYWQRQQSERGSGENCA